MYLKHYNLNSKPFQINTDPRFLWLGEKHKEALAALRYAVVDNKGFLLLTGDVGTGKTTLVNALINLLDKDTIVAVIPDPGLNVIDFFNFVSNAFKLNKKFSSKGEFINHLTKFLHAAYNRHKKVLLLIDEAQRLNHHLLEEIRLLSNIEKQNAKLINIFFVGQTEFNDMLTDPRNRAIRQRITINYNITPLSENEIIKYINHRLKIAGAQKKIFTSSAFHEIFLFSTGYPRLTNIICDYALLSGYAKGKKIIDADIIRECAGELRISSSLPEEATDKRKETVPEKIQPGEIKGSGQQAGTEAVAVEKIMRTGSTHIFLYILCSLALIVSSITGYFYYFNPVRQGKKARETVQPSDITPLTPYSDISHEKKVNVSRKNYAVQEIDKLENMKRQQGNESMGHESLQKLSPPQPKLKASGHEHPEAPQNALSPPVQPVVISFGFNSFEIPDDALVKLNRLAAFVVQHPDVKLIVKGFTDTLGNASYNKMLAKFRADIVKGYLVAKDISPARIRTYGLGPDDTRNDLVTTRNVSKRRVEIEIVSGQK